MKPDTKEVEEVVVTGYGNVRKTSFTGNSVTVSRDELLKVSKTNVMKALEVYDPSFRVKTNNQWGSDPNALPEMQIRGQSSIGVKDLDRNTLSKSALENNPNLPIFIMDNFEYNDTQRCGSDSVVRFSGSEWRGGDHDSGPEVGRSAGYLQYGRDDFNA